MGDRVGLGHVPYSEGGNGAEQGAAGGGLWALLAGYLKTRGGVNEIFAGLGLNFVAQGIILWLIFGPWKRPGVASMSGTELFPPALWLTPGTALMLSPPVLALVFTSLVLTALLLATACGGCSGS